MIRQSFMQAHIGIRKGKLRKKYINFNGLYFTFNNKKNRVNAVFYILPVLQFL